MTVSHYHYSTAFAGCSRWLPLSLSAGLRRRQQVTFGRIHAILDTAFRTSIYQVCTPDIMHIGCCAGAHRCIFEGSQL